LAAARITHRLHGAERPSLETARTWIGRRATDANGSGVGRLQDVWVDAESGVPAWLLLRVGRLGGARHRLVPFEGAVEGGGQVWLPYERGLIRSGPQIGAHELLTAKRTRQLGAHFDSARVS
jgi:sporulation protein YlmC with PRC-barrel domain